MQECDKIKTYKRSFDSYIYTPMRMIVWYLHVTAVYR